MTANGPTFPPFEKAERLFRDFLLENGGSDEIVWAFREDLNLADKRQILVWEPAADRNRKIVKKVYDHVRKRESFGIRWEFLCPMEDGRSCTYFIVPVDLSDAAERLISGLTLGGPGFGVGRIGRISKRSRTLSALYRWIGPERLDPWLLDVPSKRFWLRKLRRG